MRTVEEEEEEDGAGLCRPVDDWKVEAKDDDDEEEEEVVVVPILCCTAGDSVFAGSLCAAKSLPSVFWKKLKMVAEL